MSSPSPVKVTTPRSGAARRTSLPLTRSVGKVQKLRAETKELFDMSTQVMNHIVTLSLLR